MKKNSGFTLIELSLSPHLLRGPAQTTTRPRHAAGLGFTLIELSIVLVIIGLIVGGVLVGKDLIDAAAVRAQISQIEKYQTATNTFRLKYGYLPGDIPDPAASSFGFKARGTFAGQGDGNGLIEGSRANTTGMNDGRISFSGEAAMFWLDLSQANLVDASPDPTVISAVAIPSSVSLVQVPSYMPAAKLGNGNYVSVWSGGWMIQMGVASDKVNYFTVSAVIGSYSYMSGLTAASAAISVAQAYAIDSKVDDGLPQSGRVTAMFSSASAWPAGGAFGTAHSGDYDATTGGPVTNPADIGVHTAAGPTSCYDGALGLPEQYSVGQSKGAGLNCALSFRMQ